MRAGSSRLCACVGGIAISVDHRVCVLTSFVLPRAQALNAEADCESLKAQLEVAKKQAMDADALSKQVAIGNNQVCVCVLACVGTHVCVCRRRALGVCATDG